MAKGSIVKLSELLESIETDKVGVARLDESEDSPIWHKAQKLLPGAKSVVVLAQELFPEVVKHLTSETQAGEVALRDLYNANADLIKGRLNWQAYKIVKALHNRGFKGLPLPADGGPYGKRFLEGALPYNRVAQAAGIGILGWHSLLITPEYGPRVRLACVISDAPLESSAPLSGQSPCPKCNGACVKICPAGAIAEPQEGEIYRLNKYACGVYLDASGTCAECLKVCPAGKTS